MEGKVGGCDGEEGDIRLLSPLYSQFTPSPPPHHHTTHSPHRNDVISEVHVSGSHVDRLVSHQLKVGSCVTKSVECFK